jgi:hypothetical protein
VYEFTVRVTEISKYHFGANILRKVSENRGNVDGLHSVLSSIVICMCAVAIISKLSLGSTS